MRYPEKNLNRYCAAFLFIKIRIRFLVLVTIIFWLSTTGFSQDFTQTPLTWKINYLHDQISQESLSYTCSFKTNGLQDIMWIQKNGKFNTVLNVTDLTGSWSNIDSIGVVKYAISAGAESGSISFERTAEGIFAYLALSQGTAQPLNYKFSVSKITVN